MNIKRSSASRGELTKAMSATLREVRLHHEQIAALLAGMQQLMDGQAALGEAFEKLRISVKALETKSEGMMESLDLLDESSESIKKRVGDIELSGPYLSTLE